MISDFFLLTEVIGYSNKQTKTLLSGWPLCQRYHLTSSKRTVYYELPDLAGIGGLDEWLFPLNRRWWACPPGLSDFRSPLSSLLRQHLKQHVIPMDRLFFLNVQPLRQGLCLIEYVILNEWWLNRDNSKAYRNPCMDDARWAWARRWRGLLACTEHTPPALSPLLGAWPTSSLMPLLDCLQRIFTLC